MILHDGKMPEKKKYLAPQVVTYTSQQIREALGPAQACSTASPCAEPGY